jgi:hypothetical protein
MIAVRPGGEPCGAGTGKGAGKEQASGTGNLRRNQGPEQAEQVFSLKREDSHIYVRKKERVPNLPVLPALPVPPWDLSKSACAGGMGVNLPVLGLPEWAICAEVVASAPVGTGALGSAKDAKGPVILRDGRVMWRFRAGDFPRSPADETAALIERVRRAGVVLVADGVELHVVERRERRLHPQVLRSLQDNAGAVIAVLRGEHRARVLRMRPDQVAAYDPRAGVPR